MTFLSKILKPHFTSSRGLQGIQGTSNSTQGIQGIQGIQGVDGLSNGTLITNTQPSSYTLQSSDVGKVVSGVSTVGIPSDVFNPGENIVILNDNIYSPTSIGTMLDIEGKNPAISIYQAGVGIALTQNGYVKRKSFISLFCTRLNEFIISGNIFGTAIVATGGTVIDSDGYRIHVFTGTGPFNVSKISSDYNTVEYVVVAGGGGSGPAFEGGGGAGGFRTGTNFPITVQDYTITVGGGGPATGNANGSNSIFSSITASGGGFGGSGNGNPGGSGGGAGIPGEAGSGNTPPTSPPQGNPGAGAFFVPVFPFSNNRGGGGGGAGGAGNSQNGGIGSPVTWVPASYGTPGPAPGRYFSGGGGALTPGPSVPTGTGGSGGGGDEGSPGTVNTGGGGGGNATTGGSGIVIIRYPIT